MNLFLKRMFSILVTQRYHDEDWFHSQRSFPSLTQAGSLSSYIKTLSLTPPWCVPVSPHGSAWTIFLQDDQVHTTANEPQRTLLIGATHKCLWRWDWNTSGRIMNACVYWMTLLKMPDIAFASCCYTWIYDYFFLIFFLIMI